MAHYFYVSLFLVALLMLASPAHAQYTDPGDDPLRLNHYHDPTNETETVHGFRMQGATGTANR